MTTLQLISHLRSLGIQLWIEADRLRFGAPQGVLTPELKAELAQRRSEIIAFLQQAQPAGRALAPLPQAELAMNGRVPLSFAQQRLWFLAQLDPAGAAYNVSRAVRLAGPVRVDLLERSLNEVIRRHAVLRTTFAEEDGEAWQVIAPEAVAPLPLVDLGGLSPEEREAETARLAAGLAHEPFDLGRGPLLRVVLLRWSGEEHMAIASMHHIVGDGWSNSLLFREMGIVYAALLGDRPAGRTPELPELPIQYADFAVWQRQHLQGKVLEEQLAYWKEELAGAPEIIDLPTDRPRAAVRSDIGAWHASLIPRGTVDRLKDLGQDESATLFMVLLAAFDVLLYRYSGQPDIVVGSPIANRGRTELEALIGFFVNTLVLRTRLAGGPTYQELLARVRQTTLGAYAHQDLPFERLVEELRPERRLGENPLFQVTFIVQGGVPQPEARMGGFSMSMLPPIDRTTQFDLSCDLKETAEGMEISWRYKEELFDAPTVARLAAHYLALLEDVVRRPGQPVAALALLSPAESQQVLVEWSQTAPVPAAPRCLHERFQAQAAARPDQVAVVDGEASLTYGELAARSRRLARHLRRLGIGPEERVGVCLERSQGMVTSLLAILESGAAYVPLDPAYPPERIAFMAEDAGLRAVVTDRGRLSVLPADGLPCVLMDEPLWEVEGRTAWPVGPASLAYLIYTSGSTGRPKGVAITHGSAAVMVEWAATVFGPEDLAGVLASTSLSFDLSVFELFVPLSWGGTVILAANALELPGLAAADRVRLVNTVPSALGELVRSGGIPAGVRTVNLAGEPLPRALADQVYALGTVGRLWNLYGPSEDTTYSTFALVPAGTEAAPTIGRPVAGTRAYVVDADLSPVPLGVPGQLLLGGSGLARGYLGQPALTAERFIPDPFGGDGERLYQTGDRVRWLARNGELEFFGRLDHQVKVRGFRIELGEIEAALSRLPGVRQAAVLVRENTRLVAYVAGEGLSAGELRDLLRESLPDYMLPSGWVWLESLPLTPNGKVDRKALARLEPEGEPAGGAAPATPTEELLAAVWSEVLGVEKIGRHDDFFSLGGHSLLATRVMSRLRGVFGVELALRELFEAPALAALAGRVDRALRSGSASAGAAPPLVAVPRGGELPLSFAQQRLWLIDQLEPGSALYNIPLALRLSGGLNPVALAASLGEIERRHEALRTVFASVEGAPRQVIEPPRPFALGLVDLSGLPGGAGEAETSRLAAAESRRPFDLGRGPLWRGTLLQLENEEHVILLTLHHIAGDGWSLGVLVREVAALYAACVAGQPSPLPELKVQYADYAAWQRGWLQGEVLDQELEHWRRHLEGAPPLLALPTDRARPAARSGRGATRPLRWDDALASELGGLCRRQGATLFMALLAGFQALLARLSGQDDVSVGTPVAGRTRMELEGLVGLFVNALVVRVEVSAELTFAGLLARVRRAALEAFTHQDLPFERVVEELAPERSLSHTPLFQAVLALQNLPLEPLDLAGLRLAPWTMPSEMAKFDLTLTLAETPAGLAGDAEYDRDLFDAVTVERWLGHLERLLAAAVRSPDEPLWALPALGSEERHQVLYGWNDTALAARRRCLHELLDEQVERTPDAVAVVDDGLHLSYQTLGKRSRRLAGRLAALGVGAEVRVGLCLERGVDLVVGLAGVLQAGGGYVPVDPAVPDERLAFVLRDAGVRVVITQAELLDRVTPLVEPEVPVLLLGDEMGERPVRSVQSPGLDSLAYVIYTSGSTGRPKGVQVTHGNVAHLFASTIDRFGFGAGDVWTLFHSFAFDFSVWEMWGALLHGGRLVIVPHWVSRSPEELHGLLLREGVTVLNQTPSSFRALVQVERAAEFCLSSLRAVIFGGEALDLGILVPWLERHDAASPALVNMYGITETTVHVTWRWLSAAEIRDGAVSPIGGPIPNLETYLVDRHRQPVPLGVAGEIWVGGQGVARGYLGRPELTAERFVPHPWSGEPGARLYRSGDLARRRPEGGLEYLGRIDHQVKIRGFRVELGEIEAVLSRLPGVRQAAVLAQEEAAGGARLAAFVEGEDLRAGELRELLRERLPDYMVPSAWVLLDSLPLTGNGKVDRKALARLVPEEASARPAGTAPRTPTEELLAAVWCDVLALDRVGQEDDFFALGGHSLLATRVMARLRGVFGVELELRELFEEPTLAGLAGRVDRALRAGEIAAAPPLEPAARTGDLPLSFAQQRLWLMDQLEPGSAKYNIPLALRLSGDLDAGALAAALGEIGRRHEALRTVFAAVDGEPRQVIEPPRAFPLGVVDLSGLNETGREVEAARLAALEAQRPFDLARGPLWRGTLLRLAADEHLVLLTVHHIAGDARSLEVLVREVAALYPACAQGGTSPLPELSLQYADYAAWQRGWLQGEVLEREVGYWRNHLAGAPPLLALPVDRPRPAVRTGRGATVALTLPEPLSRGLQALSRREGATLFMTLLAAFQTLLGRYAGQPDVTVGTPIAGRQHAELEGLIGCFVNTLVLRSTLRGEDGGPLAFTDLLARVRESSLAAYAHQELPFEKLVEELVPERSLSHSPLFQVMLAFENTALAGVADLGIAGLTLHPFDVESGAAKFDLTLFLAETAGGIAGRLEYDRDLFDGSTAERLLGHLRTLLEGAVAHPGERVAELPLLSAAERRELLEEWNATAAAPSAATTLPELFEAQAARTPEAVALRSAGEDITYRELNARANRLARHLRRLGVGPDVLVGLCLERSPALVTGVLGVLKAGGAYLPLDPAAPPERLALLIEDAGAGLLLTRQDLRQRLPQGRIPVLDLDAGRELCAGESDADLEVAASPENLAYVIYTSGSTGRPKGVMIPHRGLLNYLTWATGAYGVEEGCTAPVHSPLGFDLTVTSLFAPLVRGGNVLLLPEDGEIDALAGALRGGGCGLVKLTPAHLAALEERLADADLSAASGVLVVGGEALFGETVAWWRRRAPGLRLINEYGPTETVVGCSIFEVTAPVSGAVPIGRPIANTRIYLLDDASQPVPRGVTCGLYVGGAGVARGYLGRPDLTAERFVPDPFADLPGGRLYRTGDLARLQPTGDLEYLGRDDHQVKVRGFRIELGEIEAVLGGYPGVREAAVLVRDDSPGGAHLVGHVAVGAVDRDAPPAADDLRRFLAAKLPAYMVPAHLVVLDELPLTANGKVDRRALLALGPVAAGGGPAGGAAPRTALEELLAGIWAEVLWRERVGIDESFFDLGGHSLLATQAMARLSRATGVELPLRALFETPTVEGMARRVEEALREGVGLAVPPLEPLPRDGRELPLSFAQERLWLIDRLEAGSAAYNTPTAFRLSGRLDLPVLAASLTEIVRRHESLRTRFETVAGQPRQVIDPPAPVALPVVDLSALAAREEAARRLALEEAERPFDLARGPLLRATLLRLAPDEHVALFTLHHIVSDGWSAGVLVSELTQLYVAFLAGRPSPLAELPIQYADFAAWQRGWLQGEVLEAEKAWWRQRLAGAPALLDLPLDRPRSRVRSSRGSGRTMELPAGLARELGTLSRRRGTTLFMTLLAALQALLSRYTGQEDIPVGSAISNRTRHELEGLIGFLINTLVMRTDLSGDPPFIRLLDQVREVALGAYTHQDLPFERVVEELGAGRDLGYTPLFQVAFQILNAPAVDFVLPELALTPLPPESVPARADLVLNVTAEGEALSGHWSYSTDLFDASTVDRLGGHLRTLLTAAAAGPDLPLSALPLLSAAESSQLLQEWNDTVSGETSAACLHEIVAARAAATPDAVAVVFAGRELTYGELSRRAGRLARHLTGLGVGPEVPVGLCLERSPEMVIGLLAIWQAGGAYLPLDPTYPAERLAFMLEDAGVLVLLTQESLAAALPQFWGFTIRLDDDWPAIAESDGEVQGDSGLDNLAYVIYTSGSTGRPKGVMVPHRGLPNLARAQAGIFDVGPGDRVLQFASSSFDASVSEIVVTLAAGATLCLADRDALLPGPDLLRTLREMAIDEVTLPPSALAALTATAREALPALRTLVVAGEACPPELASEWGRGRRFVNAYGPTEATVCASAALIPEGSAELPIGRAIDNVRLYLLDRSMNPAPAGVVGEIHIGGAGLARGYLGRPELTAEVFLPDPFGSEPGARLYRTGDLARRRVDGNLLFLGRIGHQVKVRGFRIELGEIEAALLRQPGIREAVVLAREGEAGDRRLVACVVADGTPGLAELRAGLGEILPDYMLPAELVLVDAMPLTANGKVDRQALLGMGTKRAAGGSSRAPRTALERWLADRWGEVLGVESVGLDDDFFELGGNSLNGAVLINLLQEELREVVYVVVLFEAPTIEKLAAHLLREHPDAVARLWGEDGRHVAVGGSGGSGGWAAIRPRQQEEGETLPLSYAQQRLWLVDQLEPGNPAYNIPGGLRMTGRLDRAALAASVSEIVRRHEGLRTHFVAVAGEPRQVIAPPAPVLLPLVDLAGLPAAAGEGEALRLARAEAVRPFDLARDPLLRVTLLRLAERDHAALFTMHHIVSDGWSRGILVEELRQLYTGLVAGRPAALPELPIQYADFARWQREWLQGPVLEAQLDYWRRRLSGAATLDLPADRPRPPVRSFRGASRPVRLAAPLGDELAALSRRQGASLFMTMLAALQALLHRYTGQDDVTVGSVFAGRNRKELEGLIGFFLNTLVMRTDLSGRPSFGELLGRVREVCLGAFAHQDLPFEEVVAELAPGRDLSRAPLFEVLLGLQNVPSEALELPGLTLRELAVEGTSAKFDLTLNVAEEAGGLAGRWMFNVDIFDTPTIDRLQGHFAVLLAAVARDPGLTLAELPLLSAAERQQLLEWNTIEEMDLEEACLHELIEAQAARTPDALAVVFEEEQLTYRELDRRANRLARHLRRLGVGPEVRVGLCVERSIAMMVGLLGTLKAGGAYVPLDPKVPRERLEAMLDGVPVLLTQESLAEVLPAHGRHLVRLDADWQRIAASRPERLAAAATPGNTIYVIYTSGSTGVPKGVVVEHRQVLNHLRGIELNLGLAPGASTALVHPITVDGSKTTLYGPLISGGTLHVISRERALDAEALTEYLERHWIDCMKYAPSHLSAVRAASSRPASLLPRRWLLFGGEVSRNDWALGLFEVMNDQCRAFNHYGPTETAIGMATCLLEAGQTTGPSQTTPLGRPLLGTFTRLLDRDLNPVPLGVPAELFIGGRSVTRGYLGRPDVTAEKFVPDPAGSEPGARLYRSGDLVRSLPDGRLEFLGRLDHQVKIRGHRIELGEIQAALAGHPAVREAVVLAREDWTEQAGRAGERRLVAYVVARIGSLIDIAELRSYLTARLPEPMLPSAYVELPALPLSAHGKLDLRALPVPSRDQAERRADVAMPQSEAERLLAGIWAEVLDLPQVGIHDNYFELGGDSILSIQIVARANRADLALTPRQVFLHQTIAELAAVAGLAGAADAEQELVTGTVPLTPAQRRFFEDGPAEPHHFNQALLLSLPEPHEPAWLERAWNQVALHHDALRLRFVRDVRDGGEEGWCQLHAKPEPAPLHRVDLSALPAPRRSAGLEAAAAQVQVGFDLTRGPLLRAVLFRLGEEESRLLLAVHHLVVDAVSWRILLGDLAAAYEQLSRGEEIRLPAKTTSFKRWAERLAGHARSGTLREELDLWLAPPRWQVPSLPVEGDVETDTVGRERRVGVSLDAAETRRLLQEVPAAAHAQVQEVLLAATGLAFRRWTGAGALLVDVEGHGREELFDDVDLSRTVGWFTAHYPLLLEASPEGDPGTALARVKEQVRGIPRHGVGYGLLRYLDPEAAGKLVPLPTAQVVFNYLGRVDSVRGELALFRPAPEQAGPSRSPRARRRHLLQVAAWVNEGTLQLEITYGETVFRPATMERLAHDLLAELRALIGRCLSAEAVGYIPSDFPLARLDRKRLDALTRGRRRIEDVYPLSPLQKGLLFQALYDAGSSEYWQQISCTLRGDLDQEAFRQAWEQAVARHAALRTGFVWQGFDEPLQVVYREAVLPWEEQDWRGLSGAEQEERFAALVARDRQGGCDLDSPPLMRLTLVRTGDTEHRLLWGHHHLPLDGWSLPVLLREVFASYHALVRGETADLGPVRPYRDYIAWLLRRDLGAAEGFWRQALAGFGAPTPLGADRSRLGIPAAAARREEPVALELPPASTAALRSLARRGHLTFNTLVQGAWALLLSRYSGRDDVVFGVTVAGRPPEVEGIETMVGLFINTLPLRVRLTPGETLLPWLTGLQQQQVELGRWEASSLADVQRWSEVPAGSPLFESILVFENFPVDRSVAEMGSALGITGVRTWEEAKLPLVLTASAEETLRLELQFDGRRFDDASVRRRLEHLRVLCEGLAAGAEARLLDLPLLTAAERSQLLTEWNDTLPPAPLPELCVHELIAAQARRAPDAVAVVAEGRVLSYGELDRRANRLAHHLRSLGVGPEARVAVLTERSPEMLVGILGVLKAGGAYVPLDPAYPKDRLELMGQDCGAVVLLAQEHLAASLPPTGARLVLLDAGPADGQMRPGEAPVVEVQPDNPAYVIYTSGSTGRPKGAIISHRALVSYAFGLNRTLGLTAADRVLQFAALSFDVAVEEIFPALVTGAAIVLRDPFELASGEGVRQTVEEEGVTVAELPTAFWNEWVFELDRLKKRPPACLRLLLVGGDHPLPERLAAWLPFGVPLVNAFGLTEVTVTSITYRGPDADSPTLPIGRPFGGNRSYVLDADLRPVPVGVVAELFLGGTCLARGYLGRPDLTAERFVPDPYGGPGARMYTTGDLACQRLDGRFEFLGRADHQVKVRGFRIEPGEIEAALSRHPGVRDCVVMAREDGPGDRRLVAYVVGRDGFDPSDDAGTRVHELRGFLADRLPEYMVPALFVFLDALPLTPTGKIDRKALPAPEGARLASRPFVLPHTVLEGQIAAIWSEVLHLDQVGAEDNFFELGGHSLSAIQVVVRLTELLGTEVPVRTLFLQPTVRELAASIEAARRTMASADELEQAKEALRERIRLLRLAQEAAAGEGVQ